MTAAVNKGIATTLQPCTLSTTSVSTTPVATATAAASFTDTTMTPVALLESEGMSEMMFTSLEICLWYIIISRNFIWSISHIWREPSILVAL